LPGSKISLLQEENDYYSRKIDNVQRKLDDFTKKVEFKEREL